MNETTDGWHRKKGKNRPIFKTARTSYKSEGVNSTDQNNNKVDTYLRRKEVLLSFGDQRVVHKLLLHIYEKKSSTADT
jgi:hypothetical protein